MTAGGFNPIYRTRILIWVLISAALLLFAFANAHLVYVAFKSQPDCVPHLTEANENGKFRAAKPAC
ncbi:hypothetical protein AUC71_12690 [Methyloceanibacter marginalis]|uniref:Uncharacterized protein n=1 Tax=Methyloceanibacter marginalis TaxID=1774971 RepID=A0A1E3WAR9_9HYPH|nr:hypothetical protein AUC71_12690 [Methyloceanibacter marginalis]